MEENKNLIAAEEALNLQKQTTASYRGKVEALNKLIPKQLAAMEASSPEAGVLHELNATLAGLRVDKLSGLSIGNKLKDTQKLIDAEELRLAGINKKRKTLAAITTATIEALRGRIANAEQEVKDSLGIESHLTRQLAVEFAKDCETEYREAARLVKTNLDHIRALDLLLVSTGLKPTGILSAGYFELRIPRLLNQEDLAASGDQFNLVRDTPESAIDGQALSIMGELLEIDAPIFKPSLVA